MIDFMEMGQFLAKQRRRFGFTQEMVAEIVGVTDKTIRNIEYGITSGDMVTIFKLWDLYGLPSNFIFMYYTRDKQMEESIRFFNKKLADKKKRAKKNNKKAKEKIPVLN